MVVVSEPGVRSLLGGNIAQLKCGLSVERSSVGKSTYGLGERFSLISSFINNFILDDECIFVVCEYTQFLL